MNLHGVVLMLHSALRWIVLLGGAVTFGRAVVAASQQRKWSDADTRVLRGFVGAFDLQVGLGLLMYFGTSALGVRMLPYAMQSSVLRFFAIEHAFGMLVAAAVLHIGTARGRRLGEAPRRQRRTAVVVGVTLAIVLVTIPWWFFPYARPLLRLE